MAAATSFEALFYGRLKGLLDWQRFEALMAYLRGHPEGWFVRDFSSSSIPDAPLSAADFLQFLDEAEAFLRKRHREEYCGFAYLDDMDAPSLIKLFDPRKMGSACGCGGEVQPRWTLSRMKPVLEADLAPATESTTGQRGWLARLFGG